MLLSYIQPFSDGNKRTARITSNAILIANKYCPISFRSVDSVDYKKAMLIFHEQNNISAFKKIFIDQFAFAVQTYFWLLDTVLFDMKLPTPLRSGPAGRFNSFTNSNIIGAIEVVKYFLKQISTHRYQDFCKQIDVLLDGVENDNVAEILNDITGFDMNFA